MLYFLSKLISAIIITSILVFSSCLSCVIKHYNTQYVTSRNIETQKYYPAVAKVTSIPIGNNGTFSGTAFAITEDYLLTAGHVCTSIQEQWLLEKAEEEVRLILAGPDGNITKKIEGEIISIDEDKDICLLYSENHLMAIIPFVEDLNMVQVEDEITIIGAPAGIFPVRVTGTIIQVKAQSIPALKDFTLLQAHVIGGNSGSPVIWNGQIIGMVIATITKMPDITIVTPIDLIKDFLDLNLGIDSPE